MGLSEYKKKRNFGATPEPAGKVKAAKGNSFVIQKHAATRLHYDFRLEMEGVLRSWAVPKGPSLDPGEKRLAVHVEDHPIDYGDFEGIIPKGQYGGGTVLLWDRGTWEPLGDMDPVAAYKKGHLKFRLDGEKLHGGWALVRMGGHNQEEGHENWLLIKEKDDAARSLAAPTPSPRRTPTASPSGRAMAEIAADPERVWQSGTTPRKTPASRTRSPPRPPSSWKPKEGRQGHQESRQACRQEGDREAAGPEADLEGFHGRRRPQSRDAGRRRGPARDPGRRGAARRRVGSRDQVRRLPRPLRDPRRRGPADHPRRQGLDRPLRRDRPRGGDAAGGARHPRRRDRGARARRPQQLPGAPERAVRKPPGGTSSTSSSTSSTWTATTCARHRSSPARRRSPSFWRATQGPFISAGRSRGTARRSSARPASTASRGSSRSAPRPLTAPGAARTGSR